MKNLWSNNWQAKLISFVIATIIWMYLRNLDDPSFFDRLWTGTFTPGH